MSEEIMVRMHQIHKHFNGTEVLKGIDLEVKRGEVLAIIGPSGSGKSTLLRCLNHLESIDHGSIEVAGHSFAGENDLGAVAYETGAKGREILSHMGMVFQQFNLFPHMTVLENLIEAPILVKKEARTAAVERARQDVSVPADVLLLELIGGQP